MIGYRKKDCREVKISDLTFLEQEELTQMAFDLFSKRQKQRERREAKFDDQEHGRRREG